MSNITIKTKRVKFSMDETPPEQFLNSPFYDCSGDTDFNNNVYLGNYDSSSDFANTNWQNNPYGNIGTLGNQVNDQSNWQNNPYGNISGIGNQINTNNVPVMDYGTPKPYMGSATNIDANNNNVINSNNGLYYNTNILNDSSSYSGSSNVGSSSGNYYNYIGSSNYTSSSAALSSFTVPTAAIAASSAAATDVSAGISLPSTTGVASVCGKGSQPEKTKEESKEPPVRGLANSILLAPRVARPGDGTPTGLVPAKEPGGKDTKIAIATDSVLAPAKHHISRIFNKHGITCSFSPNLEKLTEITGNVAYLFCLYKEYCRKRNCKTVNMETYGRLFRNEFKR